MWTQLKSMFEESNRRVKIHGGIYEQGVEDVAKINASPESCIGAIITNTCGISVDNWICILGQSSNQHAGVTDFDSRAGLDFGDMLVVAIDIVGGVFALNMGRFETDQGLVWYFAPDTVEWESLELKYSEFITWVATGDLDGFYEAFRWNNWEKDVEGVDGFNDGIQIFPFLWSEECDIESASKKVIPLKEIIGTNLEFEKNFMESEN